MRAQGKGSLSLPKRRLPDPVIASQCQVSARPILSGMCPVCTRYIAHPGVRLLLQTKAQPQFDRTVTERSKFLSHLISRSNLANCWLPFASCSIFKDPGTSTPQGYRTLAHYAQRIKHESVQY